MAEINLEHEELFKHLQGIQYIVINTCYGGFSLSRQAQELYLERAGIEYKYHTQQDRDTQNRLGSKIIVDNKEWSSGRDIKRDDPILVGVVRQLGRNADGENAKLKVVEVPARVQWNIAEYNGKEWVEEKHRVWR
jgi:hypothetical protein